MKSPPAPLRPSQPLIFTQPPVAYDDTISQRNQLVTAVGAHALDTACQVVTDRQEPYLMHGAPHLERHPVLPNTCVHVPDLAEPDWCDAMLSDAVASITRERILMPDEDADRCVLRFRPGLAASQYTAFESTMRDRRLKNTGAYRGSKASYDRAKAESDALLAQINQLNVSLTNEENALARAEDARALARWELSEAQADVADARARLNHYTQLAANAASLLAAEHDKQVRLDAAATQAEKVQKDAQTTLSDTNKTLGDAKQAVLKYVDQVQKESRLKDLTIEDLIPVVQLMTKTLTNPYTN